MQEFVTNDHWVHLDIAGVFYNKDEVPYLAKGMSGNTFCAVHVADCHVCGCVVTSPYVSYCFIMSTVLSWYGQQTRSVDTLEHTG